MGRLLVVVAGLVIGIGVSPAWAWWQYAEWGMSPGRLVAASAGHAVPCRTDVPVCAVPPGGRQPSHMVESLIKEHKDLAPSYSSIEGFIAAKVLVEGLRRAGKQPTREKLIAGLESMKQYDLGGLEVTYGRNLRTGTSYIDLTIIGRSGNFVR
jgi:ABC-type branched-subunit amino acid transport system substrate-binding protein